MKKTITAFALFILLMIAMSGVAYADEGANRSSAVSSISIYTYPSKTVYGAFEKFDTSGLSLRVIYSDGSESIVSGKDARVSYNRDNCFRVGDDSVLISYGGRSLYIPVTVNRISYDLSNIDLEGIKTTYNGKFQGYSKPFPMIVGLDGIPLTITGSGGGVNAGIYDLTIDFHTDSRDYFIPESRVVTMTIEQATAEIIWENISFVYDGKSKLPTAYYTDVNGARVYPIVSGGATNAGSGYTARAVPNDSNYIFSGGTVSYEIKKADYDFSGVVWSKDEFTYDGSKKSISASGLPSGVSIIGYSGDRASDAGIYTATAMLRWDEHNYNSPPQITHTWEIKKADYDMSQVSFRNESFVYDGQMHYPTLIGAMPIGADGIMLEYSFSAGASHVDDGVVSVVISFHTSSKNYNLPPESYSSVKITPRGIDINWGELTLSYNGEQQAPVAFAEECPIAVTGGAINAGKYIATASTSNTDYYINNDKVEYSIVKAENYWTTTPADSICYEGKDILLIGESRFGDISIKYYSDPEGINEIEPPKSVGKYYATISVSDTANYTGLTSNIISFEIVEIKPVSFLAGITKTDIKAFDKLGNGDIICSVLNNDGSVSIVDNSLVRIFYENGDSFRKKDKTVRLQYDSFVITLSVTVGYADYDLSGAVWLNTTQTYDGNPKAPTISGLPIGVSVIGYTGGNIINAGSYSVGVRLSYDKENYNEPIITPCSFTIEKCGVSIPYITAVYNGEGQIPISPSSLYSIVLSTSFTDAGKYPIEVRLTDPSNYVFTENSSSSANAIYEILPATLYIKVNDVRLRLFEKLDGADYTILSGYVYGDDTIGVSAYSEGKEVKLCSLNPNYKFVAESGKIIRLPYPTLSGAVIISLIIISLMVIALIIIKVYKNGHRILRATAMARCKWHNRGYKAPMPRECIGTSIGYDGGIRKGEEEIDETIVESPEIIEEDPDEEEIVNASLEVDLEKADVLITDSLAKSLIKREGEMIYTEGNEKVLIDVGTLSQSFSAGDRVDVNALKEKGLISSDAAYIKIIGGGIIDKHLSVYANDFSLSAVKMIALSGGQAIKIFTFKGRS